MASSAISLLVISICVLLFARGHSAAMGGSPGLTREEELPWEVSARETSPARKTAEGRASNGPVLARRELAARLGGAAKGSSQAKGTGKAGVHPDDAAALLKAAAQWTKHSDTKDRRKLLASWDVKRPCSQWYGVTCDSATHRVTAIKLPGLTGVSYPLFKLAGPFPAELGSLPELRSLILARNTLDFGPSFKAWAHLRKLSHLDLSDNLAPFSGVAVPLALCNLTSLTYLNMASTELSNLPKQFKALKKLVWLDLSSLRLVRGAIDTLGSLTNLRILFLRVSGLQLDDFSGLSRLRGLKLLDLSGNDAPPSNWMNFPTFLKALTALEDLRLSGLLPFGPDDIPTVPSWLGGLQQLSSLDLSGNGFVGSIPTQVGSLSKLARLVLSRNSLTGRVPQALLNSRSLTAIDLSENWLSLAGITFGPHASSRLKRLDLSRNKGFNGTVPKGLSSLTSLEALSLSLNLLSGTLPQFIWTFPTLTKLDLSENSFTGLGPSIQQIKAGKLKSLDLSFNKFQGSIPQGLSTLKSLTFLSLRSNQFTGSIPSWLGALRGLVFLDLYYNQLTGSISSSLFRPNLKLGLGHNQLSGNLPATALDLWAQRLLDARKYSDFQSGLVDVSGNYLTGPCYRASSSWLHNGSWVGCSATDPTCYAWFNGERSGLQQNCLQGCQVPGLDGHLPGYPPALQRSKSLCARFCGADKRNGPCNGHGSCSLKGPKKTPTCTCSKGFVAPVLKPGTCVPTPK